MRIQYVILTCTIWKHDSVFFCNAIFCVNTDNYVVCAGKTKDLAIVCLKKRDVIGILSCHIWGTQIIIAPLHKHMRYAQAKNITLHNLKLYSISPSLWVILKKYYSSIYCITAIASILLIWAYSTDLYQAGKLIDFDTITSYNLVHLKYLYTRLSNWKINLLKWKLSVHIKRTSRQIDTRPIV